MKQSELDLKYVYRKGKNGILIVICNGKGATIEHPTIKNLMSGLFKNGFSSVCFDFPNISVTQMVKDTGKILKYFSQYKKIYVLGASLGAIPAVITSIVNSEISGLITINGFFGRPKLGFKQTLAYILYMFTVLTKPKYRNDYKFFKENFIPEKVKVPSLIIYTKADKVVSPSQSEVFFKLLKTKNKKLVKLPLLKHNLTGIGDVEKTVYAIAGYRF